MIKVVCAIFAVTIEDVKVCLSNSNLPLEKSAIWFESLAHNGETDKQTAIAL